MHAASAGAVLPVFILDPHLLQREAPQRLDFLFGGLHQLDEDLRKRGSRLPVRSGEPQEVLSSLLLESGAESIHALEDYSPYAIRRDEVAARSLPLCLHSGVTVHSPAALRKADGKPTRFLRLSVKTGKPCLSHIRLRRRLEAFLDGPGADYAEGRNRVDLDGTSTLSSYFRFGMLSPRLACRRVLDQIQNTPDGLARKSYETWLNELIWRKFYNAILYEFPMVLRMAFNPALRGARHPLAPGAR